jgi:hypothetical protein
VDNLSTSLRSAWCVGRFRHRSFFDQNGSLRYKELIKQALRPLTPAANLWHALSAAEAVRQKIQIPVNPRCPPLD